MKFLKNKYIKKCCIKNNIRNIINILLNKCLSYMKLV